MAAGLILVDTSILIDFYRKTNKENSVWIHPSYHLAVITSHNKVKDFLQTNSRKK